MNKINILTFEKLSSTSTYARENATSLPSPSLIIADTQTDGRGRQGKSFYSPEGTGLYMTLLFEAPECYDMLTPAAAVAVCTILEKHGVRAEIKWVNDIFVNRRKACGILTEFFSSQGKNYISLGIGINLTTETFPDDIPQAGSVDISCDKKALAEDISECFFEFIKKEPDLIRSEYEKRLFIKGCEISFEKNGVSYRATVKGINSACNLTVKTDFGENLVLSSGEISIRIQEVDL